MAFLSYSGLYLDSTKSFLEGRSAARPGKKLVISDKDITLCRILEVGKGMYE